MVKGADRLLGQIPQEADLPLAIIVLLSEMICEGCKLGLEMRFWSRARNGFQMQTLV